MTAKRTIRTREQKLEDARKEIIRLEQEGIAQAVRLREQGLAWDRRSEELQTKAVDVKAKADELLVSLDIDPDTFWTEHEAAAPAEQV